MSDEPAPPDAAENDVEYSCLCSKHLEPLGKFVVMTYSNDWDGWSVLGSKETEAEAVEWAELLAREFTFDGLAVLAPAWQRIEPTATPEEQRAKRDKHRERGRNDEK